MDGQVNISVINQNLTDVNPLICGWETCSPGHSYGPAARDYYLLHYVRSGLGFFLRDNQLHELHSGMIFLIRPDELTSYQADDLNPWSYVWIGFTGGRCDELLSGTPLGNGQAVLLDTRLERIFTDIRTESKLLSSVELYLCAKIYEIFSVLQQNTAYNQPNREYVRRTVDYMKANFTAKISIEGIADLIGIDRRYLCRLFATEIGCTPRDYLLDLRLQRAARYLSENGYSVQDAARSVGYQDVFNFSKAFKKHFGLAPLHFKKKHE